MDVEQRDVTANLIVVEEDLELYLQRMGNG